MITKVKYTDLDNTQVRITLDDGREMFAGVKGATWLHAELNEWIEKGGVVAPADRPILEDTKAAKQREVSGEADSFLSLMAVEYGVYEKLTWDQQAQEADALMTNPAAAAPLVRAIATARGMAPLEMAQRIVANRAQWVALSGAVVGKRLAYQDEIAAAQTVEAVAAIVPVFSL